MSDLFKDMDTSFSLSTMPNPYEETKAMAEGHPIPHDWWMPNPAKQKADSGFQAAGTLGDDEEDDLLDYLGLSNSDLDMIIASLSPRRSSSTLYRIQ